MPDVPEYSEDLPTRPGYYVYRLWNAGGGCLYVGKVGANGPRHLAARLAEHRRAKPWWPDVARTDAACCDDWRPEWWMSADEALADEEARQIRLLRPLHNAAIPPRRPRPVPMPWTADDQRWPRW